MNAATPLGPRGRSAMSLASAIRVDAPTNMCGELTTVFVCVRVRVRVRVRAGFIELAGEHGLWVNVRIGPYICGEQVLLCVPFTPLFLADRVDRNATVYNAIAKELRYLLATI